MSRGLHIDIKQSMVHSTTSRHPSETPPNFETAIGNSKESASMIAWANNQTVGKHHTAQTSKGPKADDFNETKPGRVKGKRRIGGLSWELGRRWLLRLRFLGLTERRLGLNWGSWWALRRRFGVGRLIGIASLGFLEEGGRTGQDCPPWDLCNFSSLNKKKKKMSWCAS